MTTTTESQRGPRVLLVGPSLRNMGGQAVMARQLLQNLRRDRVAVDFQPIDPRPPGALAHATRIKYLRTLVVSIFYIFALLRKIPRYDVVHLFSASYLSFIISQAPAILITRACRKPLILNYRSGECDDHLTRWGRVISPLLRMVDRIVVPSGYLVDVFAKHGYRAIAIPNVIGGKDFRFRRRSSIKPRILVARMLEPLYNVGCAIRAFEIVRQTLPEATLTILGSGTQERELKALVKTAGLEGVAFAGIVDRSRIGEIYDQHDILLNTSSIDNMPVSILEAFAAGLPVVTTAAGGIPYIVEDGRTGCVVPVDDAAAVADGILRIVADPARTAALIEAAYEQSASYRWAAVGGQWRRLYEELAGQTLPEPAANRR